MKTKEELAIEYANKNSSKYPYYESQNPSYESPPTDWGEIKAAYIAGYEEAQPKWISVKDKQPDNSNPVLCLFKKGEQTACTYDGKEWSFAYHCDCCCDLLMLDDSCPTHWMPLPELPRGEI